MDHRGRAGRWQDRGDPRHPPAAPEAVSVRGTDRDALERLLRYTLRPPLAKGRLSEAPDGTVVLELKRAWSDGPSQVSFRRADFVGKLAALVPRRGATRQSTTACWRGTPACAMRWSRRPPTARRTSKQRGKPAS